MHQHYKTLGLTNKADLQTVKHAYRNLAKQYHPDINPSLEASQRFREIDYAYQCIVVYLKEPKNTVFQERTLSQTFTSAEERQNELKYVRALNHIESKANLKHGCISVIGLFLLPIVISYFGYTFFNSIGISLLLGVVISGLFLVGINLKIYATTEQEKERLRKNFKL
jgi:DnaJ domain